MAAPRYRGYDGFSFDRDLADPYPVEAVPRPRDPMQDRRGRGDAHRRAAMRRRRFLVLVVAPVLLMLGSVYLHTVAAATNERVAKLEAGIAANEDRGESLRVQATELSGPERIQSLASEELGMEPATSEDFDVGRHGREDGRSVVSQGETE